MGQLPLAVLHAQFLEFAVASAYVEVVAVDGSAEEAVAGDGHGGAVDVGGYVEDTDFAGLGSNQEHAASHMSKSVIADETGVR